MNHNFENREHAGRLLAQRLHGYANQANVLVLALPRGGAPVGFVIARELHLPLDIFLVRKLGVPGHEEYAMGAIASGADPIVHAEVVKQLNIPKASVDAVIKQKINELAERESLYSKHRHSVQIAGKTLILVDDGLATGSTMQAALQALRQMKPASIIVAIPVGSIEALSLIENQADEVICLLTPEPFYSVGSWYENFSQTPDAEVISLLDEAARLYKQTSKHE
jgi:putative phosphoribosyl transferase